MFAIAKTTCSRMHLQKHFFDCDFFLSGEGMPLETKLELSLQLHGTVCQCLNGALIDKMEV